jgi:hypothetical protein
VDLRPSTLARDLDYLNRYLIPTFGELELSDIGRYALKWGERLRILGGDGRLGQVTPPA